ncbi:YadA-like family protein [Burkholderia seminalis]|uniref:YadA-like family protein n=1 Tax=Burkholderia seminalis TaxID=488731 RepID=UPI00299D6DFF|nr:YadA-like family protein [Burkholderia seminalis]
MNKTYRTVWNATTGTWTAAAETARMRTKSKSNTTMRSSVTAAVAVMAGVGGGAMANDAMAQAANGGGSLSLCAPAGSGYYGTTFGGGNTVGTRTTAACGTAISNFRLSEGHVRSFQLYNNSNVNGGGVGQASAATEAGISGTVDGHLFLLGGSGVHLRGPVDVDSNFNMTNHRINNLAAGTAGTDAVNVNQLNAAIAAAGTANPYVVTNTGTYATATAARAGGSATAIGANANAGGTSAVALGGNTVATGQNAVALGTLANATGSEAVAVGVGARATGGNSTAMGRGAAALSTNATTVGYGAYSGADGATALGMTASAVGANAIAVGRGASTSGTYGSAIGYAANATTNAVAIGVLANATSASSVALGERASATGATSTALGRGALASGTNAVALGANSVGDRNNAVSVGSTSLQRQIVNVAAGTQNTDAVNVGQMNTALSKKVDNTYVNVRGTGAAASVGSTNGVAIGNAAVAGTMGAETAIGNAASAQGLSATALGSGTVANGEGATALGRMASASGSHATALGNQANAGANGAVAIGDRAVVGASATNSVALGTQAAVAANVTGAMALGSGSSATRNNTISVGSATQQRQIVNVAAGTQATDAVNVGQLSGVTKALGGGAVVDGSGNVTQPTYKVAGTDYHNVGDALDALAANGGSDPNAVTYDGATKDKVTLKGAGGTTLSNVKAGAADMDAVNVSQLKSSGLIGDDGKAIAAVTYDRNADGTPNMGSVTLGGASATMPVALKNVADAKADHDALNLGQLKDAGLVGDDGSGNLTSLAVTYDGTAKDSVTLGGTGATTPVAIHNVKEGELTATSKDAVNGSQLFATNQNLSDLKDSLKDGGVIDPVTGESLAVVYDGNAKDTVTLKGTNGTTLSNVKAGVADLDAVNVSQLKGSGLIGDDGKSIAAVTYDRNADGTPNYGTVTLGNGAGPTQVKNVADATEDHDALNLGQLKDTGLVGDDGKGNLTSLAVTYDGAAKDSVTLGGTGATTPVAIHNVKDGELSATSKDAVNGSQLFATNTRVGDLEDSLSKGGVIDPITGESLAVVYDGNAKDTVTLKGTNGTTLSNVKAGVADMDAVNVSQLKGSGLIGDDGKSIAAVTYDRNADGTPNYGTVTLGNGAGPTQVKNVADATDDHDALNLGQLKDAGLVGDDGKGNLTSLAVTYDGTAKDSVTLGGTGATTPVAIHNVKEGELTATSKDAVNGSQLFATNQNLSDLKDSLKDGGVIDPVTGESLAVVYDGNAKDTVTLKGTNGTTLSNVKAGVADLDAVNVSQLKGSGLIGDDGKSIAAVTYDRLADGTPNYGSVTLGNGAGPTQIKNVATGVDDLDAVNVKQLNTGLSDLRDEMSGGNLRFVKVNADPVTGTPAVASGALAVAIGSDARATSANSLALGSGARVTGNGSVAIGYNSVANQNNVVSVGDVGRERKIVNVADGDVAFQSTDAVNGGQLYAALNNLSTSVTSKTQQAIDTFSSEIDKKTKAAIDEVSSRSMQPQDVSDPLVAIEGLQGNNVASLNGADPATATAAAIGSSTAASGANAVAVGLQSGAGSNNSVAIGSFAQTGAGQDYSVAMGSNVQTNGTQAVALGANAQANGDYALAVGNNGAQAIGDGSVALGSAANVRAGSTNAVAIGTGANVARSVEGAMALGANATAGAANSVALGANAFSNRANAVSVGRAGAERQIVNVAAGTQATDAVNVSQLKGVTDALGGGAAVGADGTVTSPAYSLADPADATKSKSYDNVGDALSNLDGRTTTNTENITVINKQLADSGLVDPVTGQSITAVTYDRNADGTPNLGSVTLGGAGATAPVALKNVADAKDDHDALNLGQLKDAGLVGDDGKGNLTSLAVTYDGATKDTVTLAGTTGTTLSNVKAGVADMDAVNVSQLKGSGLIGDDGKANAAVTYDRNADGTPNYGSVTLGHGAGPTQLKNVADATDDGDALNLGQLKDTGLVGDDGKGNLTSMAVTYDGAAKDSVTLGGTGATTPVAIHNVKDGELSATSKDAVNGSQLFATNTRVGNLEDSLSKGGVIDPVTGESLAVVYDSNAKDTVTLKGTNGTTLSNVKAGVADMDAVNVSQLKGSGLIGDDGKSIAAVTYDRLADGTPNYGSVTLGNGAGPTQIKNVADATDDHDAINYNQLKQYVADNSGGSGNPLAVGYDDDTKDRVTLQGGATGTTITNVKAGAVTATSTDAINGAQLHGTAQSVADSLGGGSTVGADGKLTNPSYSLADPADASKSKSYNNVGDALSNLDGRTTTNTENITVINKQLADSGLVDPVSGQSIAAVTYDRNADGTANRGSVTLGGAGATGPVALKNIADGVDKHDAVNVGQLQSAGVLTPIDPTNPGAGLTSLAVTYDKQANGSANFDQITLKGANGTTLSNVKAGAVNATSMDAVNGSQLYGASKSVADALGGGSTVDANGKVTNPTYTVNDKTYNNVGDAIENISSSLVHGSIGLVQQDADTREITVAKETDGTSVNFAGTAGDRVLTGVGAGAVSATSRDAINGSQLHGTAQSVADTIGGGTTVDADGKLADTSIEVNGSKYKTVAEAVQAAAKYGATDSLAVRYDLNKDGTPNYGSVTLGGSGAAPVRLGNVADGSSRYDAVNFGQLSELNDKIGGLDDRVGELERNPGTGNPGDGGTGNDYFAGTDVGADGTTKANAGSGTGNTAAGSGSTIGTGANNATVVGSNANVSSSNGTAIGSGAKSSAEGATAIGSSANASGEKSTAIGEGANASGKNSVALGAGSVASSDNTVSVGTADQKRTISNLADGVNASDAATKGQMDRAIGGVQGQVNDLSRNAYSGIAAATALTMIPGVDPGKTVSFGIGGATYKGYQAVAFGGEARITQNLKMKAGVGMSSGGNTVGVGASYQW